MNGYRAMEKRSEERKYKAKAEQDEAKQRHRSDTLSTAEAWIGRATQRQSKESLCRAKALRGSAT